MDPTAELIATLENPFFDNEKLIIMNSRDMFKMFRCFKLIPSVRYWMRLRRRILRRQVAGKEQVYLEKYFRENVCFDDEYMTFTLAQRKDLLRTLNLAHEQFEYLFRLKQKLKDKINVAMDDKAMTVSVNLR